VLLATACIAAGAGFIAVARSGAATIGVPAALRIAADSTTYSTAAAAIGGNGGAITFTVHTCGVPEHIWDNHVPWAVCRVKLVGCANDPTGTCPNWRFNNGIEMTPVDDARTAYTVRRCQRPQPPFGRFGGYTLLT
jgi:hypothetical protein